MDFTLVDTEEKLREVSQNWHTDLGVDLECENNLHHYGTYISLFQISDGKHSWIVDALRIRDMKPVLDMLENPEIQKVFHDTDFDLRITHHQYNTRPKNIFDTQVAARLLGIREIGLGNLLETYFHLHKITKMQVCDWTRRPLTDEMLSYAVTDTKYLLALRDLLKNKLINENRLAWAEEEFRRIENKDLTYSEGEFWSIKGISLLSDRERAVLKRFYDLRERLAKKVDRPIYFIINTKRLIELAKNPPSFEAWRNMRGVHPIVRRYARAFYEESLLGMKEAIPAETHDRKRFSQVERQMFDDLMKIRDEIAAKLDIEKHLVMDKDQMIAIAKTISLDSLREWQKGLVKEKLLLEKD